MKKLHFEAAGTNYRKREFNAAHVKIGDPIELCPDPANDFDPYAIRLLKNHMLLAYVPRAHNRLLLPYVKAGLVTAVVDSAWPNGFCIEVSIEDPPTTSTPATV